MRKLINENQGSLLRTVVRSGLAAAVAFGLGWSGEQVGAIVILVDVTIQAVVRWNAKQP